MSPAPLRRPAPAGMLLSILLAGACGPGVLEPVEYRLSVVEGNHQVDSVLAVLPVPLRVQVQDHRNQPVPGVEVRWNAHVAGGSLSSLSSLTDAQGIAAVSYALGSRTGGYYVAATALGVPGPPAWFEVTAEAGAPVRIQRSFGGDAFGLPGSTLGHYGVFITDDHGNPVPGVSVDWLVTEGGGSVHPVQSMSADLHATTTRHTLGPQDGRQTVLAVASGLPGSPQVTFTATAVTAMVTVITPDYWDCYYHGVCRAHFVPTVVTISSGQSVGWVQSGPLPCHVVFDDDPSTPGSSPTTNTATLLRIFAVPGTYGYRCDVPSAPFMTGAVGTIVVQ